MSHTVGILLIERALCLSLTPDGAEVGTTLGAAHGRSGMLVLSPRSAISIAALRRIIYESSLKISRMQLHPGDFARAPVRVP